MGYILAVALNASIDTILTFPTTLQLGESYKAQDVHKLPGGKGLNVARVLHTLDLPVHASGFAGGASGEFIKAGLKEAGIDATFLPIKQHSRVCTAVVELELQRTTEINERGPTISEREARAYLDLFSHLLRKASLVTLSGSLAPGLPHDYYAQLLRLAHQAGVPTILDTSGAALRPGISGCPLLVKPNATEASEFLGRELHSTEDAISIGESMQQQGAEMVAITRGAEGAVLVSKTGAWLARLTLPRIVSGVGSGDAFVAGFAAGLHTAVANGASASVAEAALDAETTAQAFTLAIACGAANTLRLGAGVLTAEDVERLRSMVSLNRLK